MHHTDVKAQAKSEDSRKVLSHRSLIMHPFLTISTFSAFISRGFPCFPWILRSRDPIVDPHRVR